MLPPPDFPIVDHHCHLSPAGDGVRAALRFAHAGGTHLFVATVNWTGATPRSAEDYRAQFEGMEALAGRIAAEAHVTVYLVVAPYPIDLLSLADSAGIAEAIEVQKKALDEAARWIRERRAVALGEVGRPHFPVPPDRAAAAAEVFRYALAVARDLGCPAVVHCEDLDGAGYRELEELARSVGFPTGKLVKHYARSLVPDADRGSIVPSYLARGTLVEEALPHRGPWFLETDYLDDPRRPGAVLDLATIPRRVKAVATADPESLERFRIPFGDAIETVYGISTLATLPESR